MSLFLIYDAENYEYMYEGLFHVLEYIFSSLHLHLVLSDFQLEKMWLLHFHFLIYL